MAYGELKIEHGADNAPKPQPGQVVAPAGAAPPAPPEPTPTAPPEQPSPLSTTPKNNEPMEQPAPVREIPQDREPDNTPPATDEAQAEDGVVSWTASEFIAHEKSSGWYFGLALAGIALAGLVYLITRDYISTIVVLVGTFSLGVLGSKKPKQQQYRLDQSGFLIGQKHYEFGAFKSFAIVPEGAFSSVVFMPLKRFAPLTTIYYAPDDEHRIIELIAQHLPLEEHKLDAVDHLMQRIRF